MAVDIGCVVFGWVVAEIFEPWVVVKCEDVLCFRIE